MWILKKSGIYHITYQVIDSNGNSVTKTVKVVVKERGLILDLSNSSNMSGGNIVQTGDVINLGTLVVMLSASFGTLLVLIVISQKKKGLNKNEK